MKKGLLGGKIVILLLIFIISAFFAFYLFNRSKTSVSENAPLDELLKTASPSPEIASEFEDLTISYIRGREYKSTLADLKAVSQNANYTSYLTSYDSDGFKVNGQLTVPTGEKPTGGWPAIIFVHGYIPPASYGTLENYSSYVDYLARNGFVVFKIDLRGHGDSEGEPSGAYYSSDYIFDVLNARAALQNFNDVNPDKIGLWGHSMAGNVIFRSFAAKPEIPAVVIWAGAVYSYTDFADFGIDDNSYQPPSNNAQRQRKRQRLFDTYGQPKDGSDFWKLVAPTTYSGDLKGALQIHHAVDDQVVDIRYSRNLMDILNKTSIVHELYEYNSGGHNISGSSFNTAMQRTVDFFKAHL